MSDRTCKNYMTDGGDKLVIEGTIDLTAATVAGVVTAAVVDGLTSTDATKALSAKQGKVVNDKVVALGPVDNLESDDATKALSAKQGKALAARVAANQAASVEAATPTVAEFNALLLKLKAAGLMAADA